MAESSPKGQKTLWEKEKLLVTSNLSFSHRVFKRFVLQTRKNKGLFRKRLFGSGRVKPHFKQKHVGITFQHRNNKKKSRQQAIMSRSIIEHCEIKSDFNGSNNMNRKLEKYPQKFIK